MHRTYHIFVTFLLLLLPVQNTFSQTSAPSSPERYENKAKATITDTEMEEIKKEWYRLFPTDQPGEEDLYRAEKLLISATGSLKPLRLAPSVASVITAEEIEAMGAATLDEALESVTGLHVLPSNFNRLNANFSIRGILTRQNQQVLLLLDGVPIKTVALGARPNTFNLPVASIARIEVVRGPGSAVYGADAFAGTINVITKDSFNIAGAEVGMRAGSFGTTDNWLQYGEELGGWNIALTLEYLRSDGDTKRIIDSDGLANTGNAAVALTPGQLETDDRIIDAHLSLLKDNWSIKFWGWKQNDGGIGAGAAQILDPAGTENQEILLVDLGYNNKELFHNWDLTMRVSYLYQEQEAKFLLFPPGTVLPIKADGNIGLPGGFTTFTDGYIGIPGATSHTPALDLVALYEGYKGHLLRFATGVTYQDIHPFSKKNFGPGILDGTQAVKDGTLTDVTNTPYIFAPDNSREVWHASFQDEWSLAKRWLFTGGVRYDYYTDFGYTINPRLALVWETRYDLTSKLLYGRAFRPPSFNETSITNNPAALGNADLEPEIINTYELAFDYQPTSSLRTLFNVFYYEIDGLIEAIADPAPATTSTYQNFKYQEGYGFEFEINWQATKTLLLNSNFAFQRSKDKNSKEIVPYTPEINFSAGAHWEFMRNWSINGQYYLVADRHRANGDSRPDIKDNELVNLTMRRKNIGGNWDAAIAVRNLFDEHLLEPSTPAIANDYPMESRAVWGEVRWHY